MEIRPARTPEFIEWVQERYGDTVYQLALLQTKRTETAGYVYRQVFLHLMQEKNPFENEEHLKAWLIQVTVRCSRRFFASLRRMALPKDEFSFVTPAHGDLFSAVLALQRGCRTVVYLNDAQGYGAIEIAGLLHRKESDIRSQLLRAQIRLEETAADIPYGCRMEDVFQSVHAGEELKRDTAEKMLNLKARKSPALKYTAFTVLAVSVASFCILVPAIENKKSGLIGQGTNSSSQGTESKSIAPDPNGIQFTLTAVDKYEISGGGSAGDGKTNTWNEQFDFNLICTGENIKKVTYTAHNCEFLKKVFFTKKQVENGEAFADTVGSISGEDQLDGSVHWGFTSIGYVYSADFSEQAKRTNFGLNITYIEENVKEFKYTSQQEREKISRLRAEAYNKAYVTAEIELENGGVVHKTVKLIPQTGIGRVDIRVED